MRQHTLLPGRRRHRQWEGKLRRTSCIARSACWVRCPASTRLGNIGMLSDSLANGMGALWSFADATMGTPAITLDASPARQSARVSRLPTSQRSQRSQLWLRAAETRAFRRCIPRRFRSSADSLVRGLSALQAWSPPTKAAPGPAPFHGRQPPPVPRSSQGAIALVPPLFPFRHGFLQLASN